MEIVNILDMTNAFRNDDKEQTNITNNKCANIHRNERKTNVNAKLREDMNGEGGHGSMGASE